MLVYQAREDLKWIHELIEKKSTLSSQLSTKEEINRNSILEKRASVHSKKTVNSQEGGSRS